MTYSIFGEGSIRLPYTSNYVKACGDLFNEPAHFVAQPYIVALSNDVSVYGINELMDALNAEESCVFRADDLESLDIAFTQICDNITQDLWFLSGPKL